MIEARRVCADIGLPAPDRVGRPRRAVGSRPRTDTSMERRRRWAASGRLPPALAARFTLAEQAVLAMVAGRDGAAWRLSAGDRASGSGRRRVRDDGAQRDPRGSEDRTADRRGAARDGLPQRHERGAGRLTGMDGLASTGTSWGCLQFWSDPPPVLRRGGRVQISEGHGYSGSRIRENGENCTAARSPGRSESAHAAIGADRKRMSPALRCGRRRAGPMLREVEGCRGQRMTSIVSTTPESRRAVRRSEPCVDGLPVFGKADGKKRGGSMKLILSRKGVDGRRRPLRLADCRRCAH